MLHEGKSMLHQRKLSDFSERQQGNYMTLRNILYINTLQKHSFYVAITMIFRLFYIINTVSLVISKFFCDLEHVGRNYFAFVVLISRSYYSNFLCYILLKISLESDIY